MLNCFAYHILVLLFFFFFKFTSMYTLETGQQGCPSELSLCFSAFLKHLEIPIRCLMII